MEIREIILAIIGGFVLLGIVLNNIKPSGDPWDHHPQNPKNRRNN